MNTFWIRIFENHIFCAIELHFLIPVGELQSALNMHKQSLQTLDLSTPFATRSSYCWALHLSHTFFETATSNIEVNGSNHPNSKILLSLCQFITHQIHSEIIFLLKMIYKPSFYHSPRDLDESPSYLVHPKIAKVLQYMGNSISFLKSIVCKLYKHPSPDHF